MYTYIYLLREVTIEIYLLREVTIEIYLLREVTPGITLEDGLRGVI